MVAASECIMPDKAMAADASAAMNLLSDMLQFP